MLFFSRPAPFSRPARDAVHGGREPLAEPLHRGGPEGAGRDLHGPGTHEGVHHVPEQHPRLQHLLQQVYSRSSRQIQVKTIKSE